MSEVFSPIRKNSAIASMPIHRNWDRVLDTGVLLLEKGDWEAFTIAGLCMRAGVPPRALYARAATTDASFLAVYETRPGLRECLRRHRTLASGRRGTDRAGSAEPCPDHHRQRRVPTLDRAHLRRPSKGPTSRRAFRSTISDRFVGALSSIEQRGGSGRSADEREFCFSMVFSAMVVRTAYAPGLRSERSRGCAREELVQPPVLSRRPVRMWACHLAPRPLHQVPVRIERE